MTAGTVAAAVGTVAAPVGTVAAPVGTLIAPVGTLTAPVGTLTAPVGTLTAPVGTVTAPREALAATETQQRALFRCECGHELRVFGVGRHRIYFMPSETAPADPVMNRVCPDCGRGLPGKSAPSGGTA